MKQDQVGVISLLIPDPVKHCFQSIILTNPKENAKNLAGADVMGLCLLIPLKNVSSVNAQNPGIHKFYRQISKYI